MTDDLNRSFERMQTDYVDLYFAHAIFSIDELNEDIKRWAEKAKAAGKIRFFGFSTHSNMAFCLLGASKLGWIDGIMMTYNYRLMHIDSMKRAVDACAKAGIGLTAMKTQGGGQVETNTDSELMLAGRFIKKGYTDAQAKLKAVWKNPNIASICSEMPNMTILMANVATAVNKTGFSTRDMDLLYRYARETHSDYCAGCTEICEPAINGQVPIGDVMRYLMYCRSYGDRCRGAVLFNEIPKNVRLKIPRLDYSLAEKRCPQELAIGKLMWESLQELS
jgi:predicted aldo/keto reductase-like oxidoreductase